MAAERAPKDLIPKDFGKRVAEGIKEVIGGEKVLAFSRRAGIRNSTLRSILAGSVPGVDKLLLISRAAGTTVDELLAAAVPQRKLGEPGAEYGDDDFVHLPRLSLGEIRSEQVVDFLTFKRSFILSLGMNPEQAAAVLVAGDAMWPTLAAGDVVLVDRGSTRIQRVRPSRKPHIYVFAERAGEGRLSVGRLHLGGDAKRWQVTRDNDAYEPTTVRPEDVRVIGRVRWVGGVLED